MNPPKSVIFLMLILYASNLLAQKDLDIKVRKAPAREFSYQGKPVSPIALINIFPVMMGDEEKPDTVDLRKFPFPTRVYIDSDRAWVSNQPIVFYSTGFRYSDDYSMQYSIDSSEVGERGEVTGYEVLGITKGHKFIVHGYLNTGGSWNQEVVFILDIKGNELIKSGGFSCDVSYDKDGMRYPIIIKDDKIINGSVQYIIPRSAL